MDPVYVAGVAMTPFSAHHRDQSVTDLACAAIDGALLDAGVTADDITELVFANESDHLSGQLTLVAGVQSEIGFVDKPVMRVEAGGASGAVAVRAAAAMVRCDEACAVVVCGAEKTGRDMSVSDVSEIFALSADAHFEFPTGVTFPALYALMIQAHSDEFGTTMEQVACVAVKNLRNGVANPFAHRGQIITVEEVRESPVVASPYRVLDCSVLSDGAAAVIVANEQWFRVHGRNDRPPVAIVGSGAATAPPRLGDRLVIDPSLAGFAAKRAAALRAYAQAGVTNPARDIDVAEVYDSFSGVEVQAYEDLGFCAAGEGGPAAAAGRFDFGGDLVVNPSGGLLARGAASGATGVAQLVEVVQQLRGDGLDRQVDGASRGLTDTHAGVGSICVVHVLERCPPVGSVQ